MKNEDAAKTPKAAYVPPALQKQQLIEEVLGQFLTSHGAAGTGGNDDSGT